MRILAVSDLHFGLKQFDWVVTQADAYDAIVIAGDLLDIAGHLDLDAQITVVEKYLHAIAAKTRLLVCSGNHDGDVRNAAQEYTADWLQRVRATGLVVDGGNVDLGPLRVSVCPWWDGPASQAEMQTFLRNSRGTPDQTWLWVHHAPPDGVGVSWTGKEFAGDSSLVAMIHELQPHYVFSGHIHNSPFRNGGGWSARVGPAWVFNAGRQLGAPPARIEVDLGLRTARWVSQAGVEEISFDAAPGAKPSEL